MSQSTRARPEHYPDDLEIAVARFPILEVTSEPIAPSSDFTPVVALGQPHKLTRVVVVSDDAASEGMCSSAPSDDAVLSNADTTATTKSNSIDDLVGLVGCQGASDVRGRWQQEPLCDPPTPTDAEIRDSRRRSLMDGPGRARRGAQTSAEIHEGSSRAVDEWMEHLRYYRERRQMVERMPRLVLLFCLVFCLAIQPLCDATNMLLSLEMLPRLLVLFAASFILAWWLWLEPLITWFSWDVRALAAAVCPRLCPLRITPLEPSAAEDVGPDGPPPNWKVKPTKGVVPLPAGLEAQPCACPMVPAELSCCDATVSTLTPCPSCRRNRPIGLA
jgi:hypothetical protein